MATKTIPAYESLEALDRDVLLDGYEKLQEIVVNLTRVCCEKNRQIRQLCAEMVRRNEQIARLEAVAREDGAHGKA